MKKKIKKAVILFMVFGLCLVNGNNMFNSVKEVNAGYIVPTLVDDNGVVDYKSGPCSIVIEGKPNLSLKGKKFNVYKILNCTVSADGGSVSYTVNSRYKDDLTQIVTEMYNSKGRTLSVSDVDEAKIIDYIQVISTDSPEKEDSEYRKFMQKVEDKLTGTNQYDKSFAVVTGNNQNKCTVKGLEYGYYLLDEASDSAGMNTANSLCLVTTAAPASTIQIKADYPVVSKKIKEDDPCSDILDAERWNDIGDYEIGQKIPYKFTSTIPNINGYEKYYYCWHDIMDDGLELYDDNFTITINGNTNGGPSKTYTLKSNEYTLIKSVPGETFKVEVTDIKAIIDREFNGAVADKVYGQKVTVEYNGVLNENAATKTGRPGFENDVYLEFSNDPDPKNAGSKGKTPRDTVVCFTYKINLTKVDDSNKKLKGAAFKLYRDEACQNEICINKKGNIYVVKNNDCRTKTASVEMVSDANGLVVISGLDGGKYFLKETKAPDGYSLLVKPVAIEIKPAFTANRDSYNKTDGGNSGTLISITATANTENLFNGAFTKKNSNLVTDVSSGSANIDVINKIGKILPKTGTHGTLIMFSAGIICMIAAIAFIGKKKSR